MSGGNIALSNRIYTGTGSVAAPAYSFRGDVSMGLYDPASNVLGIVTSGIERMRVSSNGSVGINTTDTVYKLDVSSTAGTAAVNMNTWPRASVSNVCIIRGVDGTIGNSINFSNNGVQNTIDPNLMTVVQSNATNGSSFKFLKSGVWSINAWFSNSSAGILYWMDVSTNNNSNVAYLTAGNPIVTLQQAGGGSVGIYFTGWLPGSSTNIYKLRFNSGAVQPGNNYYMQAMLLYETPNSTGKFPY